MHYALMFYLLTYLHRGTNFTLSFVLNWFDEQAVECYQ